MPSAPDVSLPPGADFSQAAGPPLLEVRHLRVHFGSGRRWLWSSGEVVRAVDGVSFSIQAGETFGLVGESGCGKSTLARAIVGLVPLTSGQVFLEGQPVQPHRVRGNHPLRRTVQMVFQDPYASLNPRMTVLRTLCEPMELLESPASPHEQHLLAVKLLRMVGLDPRYLNRYPHEFSGGQRQRIGIARALAARPKLLLCDEPVSALDVSIQAQVVNLLRELQQQLGLALLFIAHDLAVVRHISHRVGVMYLGRLVEVAPAELLYRNPRHPYTQALLASVPVPDPQVQRKRRDQTIRGEAVSAAAPEGGCAFAPRCPLVQQRCWQEVPPLEGQEHQVACFVALENPPNHPPHSKPHGGNITPS